MWAGATRRVIRTVVRSHRSLISLLGLVFLASVGALRLGAQPGGAAPRAPAAPAFVGSEACAACHQREHAAWQGSQHAHAMAHARGAAVLGDFNDATFTKDGVVTTFTPPRRPLLPSHGRTGRQARRVRDRLHAGRGAAAAVSGADAGRAAAGLRHRLGYAAQGRRRPALVRPLSRSRSCRPAIRCIGPASSRSRTSCASIATSPTCARISTPRPSSYRSTWSELGVGCEACHGPGSAHSAGRARARRAAMPGRGLAARFPGRSGIAWGTDPAARPRVPVPAAGEIAEIETCARCHARRSQLTDDLHAGQPFADGFRLALLEPGLYRVDGQMQDEVFNHGSFLQSRMFAKGVTCADCHDPHSQKLRAEGNAVCTQCHEPAKYEARTHHFHEPASPAGQCVTCHMPVVTYMVVDPRHDHCFSGAAPRPCRHAGHARRLRHLPRRQAGGLGGGRAEKHGWAAIPRASRRSARPFTPPIGARRAPAPCWRGSRAIRRSPPSCGRARLRGGALGPASTEVDRCRFRRSRSRGARRRRRSGRAHARSGAFVAPLARLLRDPVRQVRMEAAPPALAGPAEMRLTDAERCCVSRRARRIHRRAALQCRSRRGAHEPRPAGDPPRQWPVGGRSPQARDRRPIRPSCRPISSSPTSTAPAARRRAAEQLLRQALARNPDAALAHYSLGLALIRQQRLDAALDELRRAADLEPESARYGYVYAVALEQARRRPGSAARRSTRC